MDFSLETKNKPLCTLSAFSYIPPRRNDTKETSYFSRDSKVTDVSTYDRVFHQAEGFDMRLPRDDRRHWKGVGLNINKENGKACQGYTFTLVKRSILEKSPDLCQCCPLQNTDVFLLLNITKQASQMHIVLH